MNIALVGVLEGGTLSHLDRTAVADRIRTAVAAHLDRAPMLRRVLHRTRLGEGTPAWADAPGFDIAEHVVLAGDGLPMTDEGFLDWSAQRSAIMLDRSRPLWRMDVVPDLIGERVGVLLVLHHVVADGLRGVALVRALLEDAPDSSTPARSTWQPQYTPTAGELIKDNLGRRVAAVRRLRPAAAVRSIRTMRALVREPGRRAPATTLTGSIGPTRRIRRLSYPMHELRAAAHRHGCTVNDLLLAAVTAGLRDLLDARGELQDGLELRASVPVGALHGRAGGMFLAPLPVGLDDPAERLSTITAATRALKQHPDEGVAGIVAMPALLARLGVAWARHTAGAHINLYVTNVPGPDTTLYLAGMKLADVVPLAPLVAGVRLSVTALSYDGRLSIALFGDDHMPDVTRLADATQKAFGGYLAQ